MNDSNILQSQLTPHHSQLLGINRWCKNLCNRTHVLGLQKLNSLQVLSWHSQDLLTSSPYTRDTSTREVNMLRTRWNT